MALISSTQAPRSMSVCQLCSVLPSWVAAPAHCLVSRSRRSSSARRIRKQWRLVSILEGALCGCSMSTLLVDLLRPSHGYGRLCKGRVAQGCGRWLRNLSSPQCGYSGDGGRLPAVGYTRSAKGPGERCALMGSAHARSYAMLARVARRWRCVPHSARSWKTC